MVVFKTGCGYRTAWCGSAIVVKGKWLNVPGCFVLLVPGQVTRIAGAAVSVLAGLFASTVQAWKGKGHRVAVGSVDVVKVFGYAQVGLTQSVRKRCRSLGGSNGDKIGSS